MKAQFIPVQKKNANGNNVVSFIDNSPLAVWKKLRQEFKDGFYVDTFYNKVRVTAYRDEIKAFFHNPARVKGNQIIL